MLNAWSDGDDETDTPVTSTKDQPPPQPQQQQQQPQQHSWGTGDNRNNTTITETDTSSRGFGSSSVGMARGSDPNSNDYASQGRRCPGNFGDGSRGSFDGSRGRKRDVGSNVEGRDGLQVDRGGRSGFHHGQHTADDGNRGGFTRSRGGGRGGRGGGYAAYNYNNNNNNNNNDDDDQGSFGGNSGTGRYRDGREGQTPYDNERNRGGQGGFGRGGRGGRDGFVPFSSNEYDADNQVSYGGGRGRGRGGYTTFENEGDGGYKGFDRGRGGSAWKGRENNQDCENSRDFDSNRRRGGRYNDSYENERIEGGYSKGRNRERSDRDGKYIQNEAWGERNAIRADLEEGSDYRGRGRSRGGYGSNTYRNDYDDDTRDTWRGRDGSGRRGRGTWAASDNLNDRFSQNVTIDNDPERSFETREFRRSGGPEEEGEEKTTAPVTYVPPEFDDSEDSVFSHGVRRGINFDKYDEIEVQITGGPEVEPVMSFDRLPVNINILSNVKRAGYTTLTPVQRYAIPFLLNNVDIMACAQTGSGKTAAFLIPILNKIVSERIRAETSDNDHGITCCHPYALIVVPTRELCIQTFAEFKKFGYGTPARAAVVYGGVSVNYQANQLRRGSEIIIGTAGRLMDMIKRGRILLDRCTFLVLDEADRMLDMGFEPEVRNIIKMGMLRPASGENRCTAMFSATFPPDVQTLAQDFMKRGYSFITVGVVGGACSDVTQSIISIDKGGKRDKLKEILKERDGKSLVFVEQKRFADFLTSDLNQNGFKATSIHGDRMQEEREKALRDFVSGKVKIMVATSVAARGLDIPGVDNVINYDLPDSISDYVHRIGRTGRCGNTGNSVSFYDPMDPKNDRLSSQLAKVLKDAKQPVPDFLSVPIQGGDGYEDSHRTDIRPYSDQFNADGTSVQSNYQSNDQFCAAARETPDGAFDGW